MPGPQGRSKTPGNDTVYHRINIATAHPELLQPKGGKVSEEKITANIPVWEKNKFHLGIRKSK